jgi:hypothetical protein
MGVVHETQLRDWVRFGVEVFKSLATTSQAKPLRQNIKSLPTQPALFPSKINRLEFGNNHPHRMLAEVL